MSTGKIEYETNIDGNKMTKSMLFKVDPNQTLADLILEERKESLDGRKTWNYAASHVICKDGPDGRPLRVPFSKCYATQDEGRAAFYGFLVLVYNVVIDENSFEKEFFESLDITEKHILERGGGENKKEIFN